MPWSIDFGYTAHTAGGGLGVKTIDELFGAIQEQGMHSITELGLIGHGPAAQSASAVPWHSSQKRR